MLKKTYRELNDGLGTVEIDLELSYRRLRQLQEKADAIDKSVDSVINDAINQYLILSEMEIREGLSASDLLEKTEVLQKENDALKSQLATSKRTQSRRNRERLKKCESSSLQIFFPFLASALRLDSTRGDSMQAMRRMILT